MRIFLIDTNEEIQPGDVVHIHKVESNGTLVPTGETGIFEELTTAGFVNFNHNGKPRQCLAAGVGGFISK